MEKCSIFILLLIGLGGLQVTPVSAADITLSSKPAKCVSLKKGNICYQNIMMQWQASEVADYCLYNQLEPEPIKCWQAKDHGAYSFEFSFAETQQYVMRQQDQSDDLAVATIEVKWVYKVRRNQFSWRVF
jgi:hypothetical protein